MKQLDREKIDLEGQLKDLEWRLNNESRVRHISVLPTKIICICDGERDAIYRVRSLIKFNL